MVICVGIVFLMRLDFWKIKEVKVGETERVNRAVVLEIARKQIDGMYWKIFPKNNFLIYPKETIEKEILDREPAALAVKVNAELDHTLKLDVKERLAAALWCKKTEDPSEWTSVRAECYFMDERGIVFASAENNDEFLKYYGIIENDPLGKRFGEPNFLPELSNFANKVKELGLLPAKVEVVDKDQGRMYFENDASILFLPYEKDKKTLFENIELFINDLRAKNEGLLPAFEYIDARYGNKIFFKTQE